MEQRLIGADTLENFIENRYTITWETNTYEGGIKDACTDILDFINKQPTIEAIPVAWIEERISNAKEAGQTLIAQMWQELIDGYNRESK